MSIEESDLDLLKWAAKAAGIKVRHFNDLQNAYWIDESESWWNPVTDDGDAMYLMVKLSLQPLFNDDIQIVTIDFQSEQGPLNILCEEYASDKRAATRRAIVRAAAEIGRNIRNG